MDGFSDNTSTYPLGDGKILYGDHQTAIEMNDWKDLMAAPVTITEVKALLASKNFAPLKSLGQNFLIDRNFLTKICKAGVLTKEDLVLEVGPGLGGLTQQLVGESGRVVAVEFDRGLFGVLQENLGDCPHLFLYNQDFLEFDLSKIGLENPGFNYKVIANLPYYITSPIIFKLLESKIHWQRMVFFGAKGVGAASGCRPG